MSLSWSEQLILAPVILPLLFGAVLILINERRHRLKFALNLSGVLLLLATAVILLRCADNACWPGGIGVYLAANWAAPFGIALVADRLAALLLLLTAALAVCALLYSAKRWSRIGVHFHSLFQFLLMGLNGAFLTYDLFNLFVFFEVMLAASYGLLLHGYNLNRIRAGMQFVAINLAASLLFLIGVALIYAGVGTLNMSDLAARAGELDPAAFKLTRTGMTVLLIVFLVKSAMWPFGFWLPTAYAAASPPVAAMFVLMTKVGVYVTLRVWLPVFSGETADIAGFGNGLLFWGGLATVVFGAAGMLTSESRDGHLAGYAAIMSSGTLLAAIGYGLPSLTPALLFYLLSSTLAVATFMLLIELIERGRNPIQSILEVTREAFDFEETPEQPVGIGIPAAVAFVGLSFAGCAVVISALPPLSGFIAKFGMLHAVLTGSRGLDATAVAFMSILILSGLAAIVALATYGIRNFWGSGMVASRLYLSEAVPIGLLLLACALLTAYAGPAFSYLKRTGEDLWQPRLYGERVLSAPVIERTEGAGR